MNLISGKLKNLLLPLLGGVLLIGLIIFLIVYTRPAMMLKHGVEDVLDELTGTKLVKAFEDTVEGGSMSVSISAKAIETLGGSKPLGDISYTVWMNSRKQEATVQVGIGNALEATLWANEDEVAVKLYDDYTYGLKIKELFGELEDSILAPGSGSDYALPLTQEQMDAFETLSELLNDKKFKKYMKKAGPDYLKLILDTLLEDADFEKEGDGLNSIVTLTLDEDNLADVYEALADKLDDDKQLEELYISYCALTGATAEQADTAWSTLVEGLETSSETISSADLTIELELTLNRFTHSTKEIAVKVRSGKTVGMKLSLTMKDDIKLVYETPGTGEKYVLEFEQDGKEQVYSMKHTRNSGSSTITRTYELTWDEKSGDLELEASHTGNGTSSDASEKLRITGNLEFSMGGKMSLELEKYYITGSEPATLGIRLELNKADKMPELPEYTSLSAIDTTDLGTLMATLEEKGMFVGGLQPTTIPANSYHGYLNSNTGNVVLTFYSDYTVDYLGTRYTYTYDGTTLILYDANSESMYTSMSCQLNYNETNSPYLIINGNYFYIYR